jgi:DNA-binding MarR family transcriptional regulator
LVTRGYLQRSPDPADRRSALMSLTEPGRTVSETLLQKAIEERR